MSNLLRPGPNTVHRIDLVDLLASSNKAYFVRVPLSLLVTTKIRLLRIDLDGSVKVRTCPDLHTALSEFRIETLSKHKRCKYVHKIKGQSSVLIQTFVEAEEIMRNCEAAEQRLQLYSEPSSKKTSQLRAHWANSRPRSIYYTKTRVPRLQAAQPCLVKALPELSRSYTNIAPHDLKTESGLALTRLKPIPEIEKAMTEIVRALNDSCKSKKVTELVCDFLLDDTKNWILVGCLGYSFATHRKVQSQVIEQKQIADFRFFLFPILTQKQKILQRLRKPAEEVKESIKNSPTQSPVPGLLSHSPLLKKREFHRANHPQLASFNRTVSDYEKMLKCVSSYKQHLHGATDLVQKYGAPFWQPILVAVYKSYFSPDQILAKVVEPLSIEEQRMMLCGYMRVIKGNYNFYYETALKRIHGPKRILEEEYDSFVICIANVLSEVPITKQEMEVIVKRFRDLKHCFCLQ